MNYPGQCSLELNIEAVMLALEGAINAARKDGEDYVRVLGLGSTYTFGPWRVDITTDPRPASVPSVALKAE